MKINKVTIARRISLRFYVPLFFAASGNEQCALFILREGGGGGTHFE
jgi:hypothetical protein